MRLRRWIPLGLLVAGCLSLMSCLRAIEDDTVIYDAKKDEFRYLMILRNIRGDRPEDAGKIETFWAQRQKLIAGLSIFGGWNLVQSDHEMVSTSLDLISSTQDSSTIIKVDGSLNSIRILPGAFFVEGGKLCYYHQMVIPGKFIDDELPQLLKAQQVALVTGVDDEMKRRAEGGKRMSWELLQEVVLAQFKDPPTTGPATAPQTQPAAITLFNALDDESLKRLKAGGATLVRKGEIITAQWPLDDADQTGALAVCQALRDAIKGHLKKKPDDLNVQAADEAAAGIELRKSDQGLTAAMNLPVLVKGASRIFGVLPTLGDLVTERPHEEIDLLKTVREKKMLKDGITCEGVAKDFAAGNLK